MKNKIPFTRFLYLLVLFMILVYFSWYTGNSLVGTSDVLYIISLFLIFLYEMIKIPLFLNKYRKNDLAQVGKVALIIIDVALLLVIFIPNLIKNDMLDSIIWSLLLGMFGIIGLVVLKIYYSERQYFHFTIQGLEIVLILLISIASFFPDAKLIDRLSTISLGILLPCCILIKHSIKPKGK